MWLASIAALVAIVMPRVGAQHTDAHRYTPRYQRDVRPGGMGPNRLALDEWAVTFGQPFNIRQIGTIADDASVPGYIAFGGLGDLRLFDAANHEVPYLLVPPVQPAWQWTAGQVLPLVETKTTSGFEVTLAQPVMVDRLRIEGLPPRFLKRATLEGSGDREHWTALAPQATVFDLPDDQLRQLDIAFPASELRYLRLTWDDRNSGRVPPPQMVRVREAIASAPPAPLRIALDVEKRPSEAGRSRYRVRLPASHMPITHIEVGTGIANVLRRARVTEASLAGDRLEPRELGASTLRRASRAEDEATAEDLRIPVSMPATKQIDLTIEDGSNAPLDITGISALLAPLPWVYFESPDGAPLVARLGDRRAVAPSYDLEANRANLPKISTVTASWGPAPAALDSTAASEPTAPAVEANVPGGSASLVGASIDISEFRYMRDVPTGKAGLTALALDAAVLAHAQGRLSDLRLVDHENRQHAYVLESRDEPLTIDLADGNGPLKPAEAPDWLADALKNAPSGNRTIYRLRLPYANLPDARLTLTTGTRVFTRQFSAFVRNEPGFDRDRPGALRIMSTPWVHTDADEPPPPFTFPLGSVLPSEDLVLIVDEGDNAPLPIASATLTLPSFQIRFLRSEDEARAQQALTLYYGDRSLPMPRYDLALLRPYLLDAPASEIAPGPERGRTPATSTARLPSWAFWGVLVAAVLVLLALIGRLLRAEHAATPPQETNSETNGETTSP